MFTFRKTLGALFEPVKSGHGDLGAIYRAHFNKVDRFNRDFYDIGPPLTQASETRRVFCDLIVISFVNAYSIYSIHQHQVVNAKNKITISQALNLFLALTINV